MHTHTHTHTHTPFHPGTSFAFAKGQPIMLPSLYVNAHVPCNTTGDLTDFFFAGSFTNPGTTRFYGCVLCLPTSTHLCEIQFFIDLYIMSYFCPILTLDSFKFNCPPFFLPPDRIRMCKWLEQWVHKDPLKHGHGRSFCAGRFHPSKRKCVVSSDCK